MQERTQRFPSSPPPSEDGRCQLHPRQVVVQSIQFLCHPPIQQMPEASPAGSRAVREYRVRDDRTPGQAEKRPRSGAHPGRDASGVGSLPDREEPDASRNSGERPPRWHTSGMRRLRVFPHRYQGSVRSTLTDTLATRYDPSGIGKPGTVGRLVLQAPSSKAHRLRLPQFTPRTSPGPPRRLRDQPPYLFHAQRVGRLVLNAPSSKAHRLRSPRFIPRTSPGPTRRLGDQPPYLFHAQRVGRFFSSAHPLLETTTSFTENQGLCCDTLGR